MLPEEPAARPRGGGFRQMQRPDRGSIVTAMALRCTNDLRSRR